jgi:hypothetical protein
VADSFFKFGEIKRNGTLYLKLLASPTKNTIAASREGRLIDGVRFLEYSIGLNLFAIGISGLTSLFGDNEIVKTLCQTFATFVLYTATHTLYYFAMRNKGTRQRSTRDFTLFACLTTGFALVSTSIVQLVGGIVQPLAGIVDMALLVLIVPLFVYMVRAWKYFWGASGARVSWALAGCGLVGGLAGIAVHMSIWAISGFPTAPEFSTI